MAEGAKKFRKRLEKATKKEQLSTFGAAKRLLTGGLDKLEAAVTEFAEAPRKQGVQHCAVSWLRKLGEDQAHYLITNTNEKRKKLDKDPLDEGQCEAILIRCLKEGYEGAAYITLKVILDGIETERTLEVVSNTIADMILDELRYRRFRFLAPKLYEYKLNSFNTSSYAYMARSLNGSMKGLRCKDCLEKSRDMTLSEKRANACPHMQEKLVDLKISPTHRRLLGTKLIDLLVSSTHLVQVTTETTKRSGARKNTARKKLIVEPTPDTLEWLSKRNEWLEALQPVVMPMVVPPLQWEPGVLGGYRYALRNKFKLVRGVSAEHQGTVAEAHMPVVYDALNAIQNTAWRVNKRVFEVLEQIKATGGDLAGVPNQDIIPLPEKPANIGGKDRDAEFARVKWKRDAHKAREDNKLRIRDCTDYERRMDVVKAVKDEAAIFFPHTMDFRGRIYPVSHHFTPQGEDMSRGLLEFATGKPIGVEGARWLAIHGANCLGEWNDRKTSKLTLDERVELIKSLNPWIWSAGCYPASDTWWAKADDPVQFLAFCIEWKAYMESGCSPEHVSHLPVSVDGTCNGLQHFSAMFRDEIGGAAVNLVPKEYPSDIYEMMSDYVKDVLEKDAGTNPLAVKWLTSKLVKRKFAKTPTMTFGYGSKAYGFQSSLLKYLQTKLGETSEECKAIWEQLKIHFSEEGDEGEREAQVVQACGYMSTIFWKGLTETVVAAYQGMAWMQTCARVIAKGGQPITWTTPATGFPVKQEYFVPNIQRIRTEIAGTVIRPAVYTDTAEILLHKQANAIAPNVVHSLDAAALQLTVTQAMQEGVEHFAAIHDSYGCLAGDMPVLIRATRRCFVSLYTHQDVVGHLWKEFQEQAGSELPAPPSSGTLDLAGVLASDYFFS